MSELPSRVQSKVMALLDAEQRASTAMHMTQNAIREAQYAHDVNPNGDKAMPLAREIARLQAMQPDNQAQHRALADLNAKVRRYLDGLPAHVTLDDARSIRPKLGSGETHSKVVTRMRGEIVALIGERSRVERSTPTTEEVKALAARYVQSLAERATPRLIIEHDKFDMQFGRGMIGEKDPTPLQVLAWIDPTIVLNRLQAMIDARDKPASAMTAADRKKRLDEIKDELFELERIECAHIEAAMTEGTVIDQRPNVDIRALLGLVVSREKASAA